MTNRELPTAENLSDTQKEALADQMEITDALSETSTRWAAILYLEKKSFQEIVDALKAIEIPCCFIRHEAESADKKEHVHVMWHCKNGISSRGLIREMNLAGLKGCYPSNPAVCPKRVRDVTAAHRYMTHRDDKDKKQYDAGEVQTLFGYRYSQKQQLTAADKDAMFIDISTYILDNEVTEYRDVMLYVIQERKEWARVVGKDFAYAIKQLCDSNRYALEHANAIAKAKREEAQEEAEHLSVEQMQEAADAICENKSRSLLYKAFSTGVTICACDSDGNVIEEFGVKAND